MSALFSRHTRRRAVIALVGAVALAGQGAARAQTRAAPVIAYVSSQSESADAPRLRGLHEGLKQAGFVPGSNVSIEYRWADGHYDRLPAIVAEVVQGGVALVVAASLPTALAAKEATTTIPIVFVSGADPVKFGLVPNLPQPGANLTGISQYYGALGGKRLEMLRELVPSASRIAVMTNPKNPNSEDHLRDISPAAAGAGYSLQIFRASAKDEIAASFVQMAAERLDALIVADDPFFTTVRVEIVALAARHSVPTIYYTREFAEAGGLMAYGSNTPDNYRQAGLYAGRILRGEKPAGLPVLQPTKFELVFNLHSAKSLGLTIPPTLLARADEVIE